MKFWVRTVAEVRDDSPCPSGGGLGGDSCSLAPGAVAAGGIVWLAVTWAGLCAAGDSYVQTPAPMRLVAPTTASTTFHECMSMLLPIPSVRVRTDDDTTPTAGPA